jgi:hypothetical protein
MQSLDAFFETLPFTELPALFQQLVDLNASLPPVDDLFFQRQQVGVVRELAKGLMNESHGLGKVAAS